MLRRPLRTAAAAALALAGALSLGADAGPIQGEIALPTEQTIAPAGRLTPLAPFPTGLGLSPDGSRVVVAAGSAAAATLPPGIVDVLDAATGLPVQRIPEGDAAWGVVWSPSGDRVFVTGGSTMQVMSYTVVGGVLVRGSSGPVNDFAGAAALSPDGSRLYVALPTANAIAVLDSGTLEVLGQIEGVPAPFGLVATEGTVFASNWRGRDVSAIDLAARSVSSIPVGDHPEGMAVSPDGARILVANSNDATLSVIDVASRSVASIPVALYPDTPTDSPSAVTFGPDGRAYVAVSASNAIAVLEPSGDSYTVAGYIPTAWYPTNVAVGSDGTVHVLSARGTGDAPVGQVTGLPPENGPVPDGAYATAGALETVPPPDAAALAAYTATVRRVNARHDAAPLPAEIKHVIYVVRENKTYDEVFGDIPTGDGDPAYTLFPEADTPNAHAIAKRWVLADRFFYPGEASKTGHFWTDAGDVADIEERSWHPQGLNDSWGDLAHYPSAGLLFERAKDLGVSFRVYNEELYEEARGARGLPPDQFQAPETVFPRYDLATPDVVRVTGGTTAGSSTASGWVSEFRQFAAHQCSGALAGAYGETCDLPSIEYVYLGGDHAAYGEPGMPTPPSSVADNDDATGRLVDIVSHSPYWNSTAIVIVEDDPQSGGDHVSPYRGLVMVASPYAKRGYVTHTRHSLAGVLRLIEQVAGIPPLSQFDAMARPLDDMFDAAHPDFAPFEALPETVPFEVFLPGNAFAARGRALVRGDRADAIADDHAATNLLWEMVRGYSLDEFLARRSGD
ncbi:MAG: bifunctional YncE family protein/alkaline phosphatase family protein [Acidobacteria bacterium]|nr:bifunctional YncE family protein/alkaline phosphatase family protein [Acidobacteriota bacterium]